MSGREQRVRAEPDDAAVPDCGPDDLEMVVRWEQAGTGLRGQVIAENAGRRACKLRGKPDITPLGPDGQPLPTRTVIFMEFRSPGYVILKPGQRAAAPISWASWCGRPASGQMLVGWPGGSARARVHGPTQPQCLPNRSGNLSSSWFDLID